MYDMWLPFPISDTPVKSVQTYNRNHGTDLYSVQHDMQHEIDYLTKRVDDKNKLAAKLNFRTADNKRVKVPYMHDHFTKSKKVGSNDYVLMCGGLTAISRQKGEELCWAACIQYLIYDKYGRHVDQIDLASQINRNKQPLDSAASVKDMMDALGFGGTRVSTNGSWHIIETLGRGHPVVLGLMPKGTYSVGHAVVVIGARYSFISSRVNYFSYYRNRIKFSQLAVLDPTEGGSRPEWVNVSSIEDKISFVLSFDFVPRATTY